MEIFTKDSKFKFKAIRKILLIVIGTIFTHCISFGQSNLEARGNEIGNVRIFPNPILESEHIEIEFDVPVSGKILFTLIDQIGNPYLVKEKYLQESVSKISLDLSSSGLRPGIYFFRIQQNSKKEKVLKIIKK